MSGFLRRLAEQAMGLASPVRSAARLPYAVPPALAEDAWQVTAPDPMQQPATRQREPDKLAFEAAQLQHALPPGPVSVAESPPEVMTEPGQRDGHHSPGGVEVRQPRRTQEGAVAKVAFEPAPRGPQHDPEIGPIESDRQNSFLANIRFAEPLLPLQRTMRPGAWNAAAPAPRDPISQGQAEETTEVHVSIGRIEVTAVQEASTSKRQPPRAVKPMTLDEYLACKRRGRT